MVQIMNRAPDISPVPATSSPEGGPAAPPNYINALEADVVKGLLADHPNLDIQDNGNVVDLDTGDVLGIDPFLAAEAGEPIDEKFLNDAQLAQMLQNELLRGSPDGTPQVTELADRLHQEMKTRYEADARAHQAARGGDTDQMPAIVIAANPDDKGGKKSRRGVMDRVNDAITRMETTAPARVAAKTERSSAKTAAKTARKELKEFNKENDAIKWLSLSPEEKEAVKTKRAELEAQAGGYKAWKSAQQGERRAVTKVVGGLVERLRPDPARKELRTERKSLSNDIADAHRSLVRINRLLNVKGVDEATKTQLLAERDRQTAILTSSQEKKKAATQKALGKKAHKAVATDHDAEFDKLPMPNDEARELFRNLHNKRIKALKLGLDAGYKIRSRKKTYQSAYADYKDAYMACEAAILKHETDAEGPLTKEQTSELVTSMVIEEIKNMQAWQYQLAAEAQSTRRGRAAVKFHRQGKMTKLVIGAAAGLATGGLVGLAGGAIAGAGLVAAKVARSESTRRARGLATQAVYEVTEDDKAKYLKDSKSTGEIFNKIFTDQVTYVEKTVRKKRAGIALAGLGLIGGAVAGDWLNDQFGQSKTTEVGAPRSTTGGSTGGGSEAVPPIGEPRRVNVNLLDELRPRGGSAGAARIDGGITATADTDTSSSVVTVNNGTVTAAAEHYVGNVSPIDGAEIQYPWDVFGNETWSLADNAIAAGENLEWRGEGAQAQLWARVDGKWTSDTDTVVKLLKKYR